MSSHSSESLSSPAVAGLVPSQSQTEAIQAHVAETRDQIRLLAKSLLDAYPQAKCVRFKDEHVSVQLYPRASNTQHRSGRTVTIDMSPAPASAPKASKKKPHHTTEYP